MFFHRKTSPKKPLREQLSDIEISQNNIQIQINNLRAVFPHDADFQIKLDAAQAELDKSRAMNAVAYGHIADSENIQKYLQK
jgi:hypothetical protein